MPELRECTEGYDIVGIVETWANRLISNAELTLDGFNMLRLDREGMKGGGLLMHVNENLNSSLCTELMTGTFQESLWCNIQASCGNVLVGLYYRSPSSSNYNNDSLLDQVELAMPRPNAKHVMILGDFNYPNIDYEHEHVPAGEDAASTRFFNKTQELCLIQCVAQPTRIREGQLPSTLDYIFIDEDNLIEDVSYSEPLGKSDHVAL